MTTYIAYVDGACPNNGKPNAKAGWGAYITTPKERHRSLPLRSPMTSPRPTIEPNCWQPWRH